MPDTYQIRLKTLTVGFFACLLSDNSYAVCTVNKRENNSWNAVPKEQLKDLIARKEKHSKSGNFYMLKVDGVWFAAHRDCFTGAKNNNTHNSSSDQVNSNSKPAKMLSTKSGNLLPAGREIRFEVGYLPWTTEVTLTGGAKEKIDLSSKYLGFVYGVQRPLSHQWMLSGFGGVLLASTSAESRANAQLTYKGTGALNLGLQGGGEVTKYLTDVVYFGADLRLRILKPSLAQLPSEVKQSSSFTLFPSLGLVGGFRPKNSQNTFGLRIATEGLSFSPAFSLSVGILL